jgi:hypothetical protein
MAVKKIIFVSTGHSFFIYQQKITRYFDDGELYSTKLITLDEFSRNKNVFENIMNSDFNNIQLFSDFTGDKKSREDLIKYFNNREKIFGDKYVCTYKILSPSEITSFYTFDVWVDLKVKQPALLDENNRFRVRPYMFQGVYPDSICVENHPKIDWGKEKKEGEAFYGWTQIPRPMEPRVCSYLAPTSDIEKVIGIKRFKDTAWIGTDREQEYTDETEEYEMDMVYSDGCFHFDENKCEIFKQHNVMEVEEEK